MTTRKYYQIKMTFVYKTGGEGILEVTVKSKRAVSFQIQADRDWLAIKGHTESSLVVKEVEK